MATRKVTSTGRVYYAQDTPKAVKKATLRKQARRMAEKIYGKQAIRGKDVDHIKPLAKGGTNSRSNLRIVSRRKNRSRNDR